jgi:hypothetical protein
MKCSIIGPTFEGRSAAIDSQSCVNFYPEVSSSSEAKNVIALYGTPGLKLFASVGSGGNRGEFVTARQRLLTVIGNTLWEINEDKSATNRGTLNTHEGRVEFAEIQNTAVGVGGSQVMLVDGIYGYIFRTDTDVFVQITGNYMGGTSIVSINGRFLQNVNDTGTVIYSDLYDGLSWDIGGRNFVTEGSPDPVQSIKSINNELWIFGTNSTEIWFSTPSSDEPFAKVNSGHINTGVSGKYSVTTMQNQVIWLGSNVSGTGTIWQASGYIPTRISNHAIEYIISKIDDISDCICYSYNAEGHSFVIFNFITGNKTLVYDLTTQMWHERASFDTLTGNNNRHRAVCAVLWNNKVMVGDYANNNIYEYAMGTYTDAGTTIKRIRTAPHIHQDRKRLFFRQFELDFERGVGLLPTTGDTTSYDYRSDPQIMLSWSNDGGYTFGGEHWSTAGKIGEHKCTAAWNRLGKSRDRVFRIECTAPVRWVLIDARMTTESED